MRNLILLTLVYVSYAYKSYNGSNCAFVYDAKTESSSFFPLDVCITDYDSDPNADHPYKSREYICTTMTDGTVEIEVFTYWNNTCSSAYRESRRINDPPTNSYQCGNGKPETYDDCFLEYKEYTTITDTCEGWEGSSYTTNYIIVGTCVAVDGINSYSQCDVDDYDVRYVMFNDNMCCDLSYTFTSENTPQWKDYVDVAVGCNNKMYIDKDSWMCNMPVAARDADIVTDNTDVECTDIGNMFVVNSVVYIVIGFLYFMN